MKNPALIEQSIRNQTIQRCLSSITNNRRLVNYKWSALGAIKTGLINGPRDWNWNNEQ